MGYQIAGLVLDLIGVFVIASGVVISRETARVLAATGWNGNERLQAALVRQSRLTLLGAGIMAVGFVLQIIGICMSSP